MSLKKLLFCFIVVVLVGCSTTGGNNIVAVNEELAAKNSAYRFVKTEEENTHTAYELQPAGIEQKTIAAGSELLMADILRSINSQCGFEKDDLVETRVVHYQPPSFYEVWIFNDDLSEHENKQSAISVLLYQKPDMGGIDIHLSNECHPKPLRMVFGK